MPQKRTTYLAIVAVSLGTVGLLWHFSRLGDLSKVDPNQHDLRVLESVVLIATKASLILTGILILKRSKQAIAWLLCTLVLSIIHSTLVYQFFLAPIPANLSDAGRAGRVAGEVTGLVIAPVLYIGLLCYLLLPRTRAEFTNLRETAEQG
jgi:uncharacterized membrane protein